MHLTDAQQEEGRRNFLNAIAGTRAIAELTGALATRGPKRGGPVRVGLVGPGQQGLILLSAMPKSWVDLRAICDINPNHARGACEGMAGKGWPKPREYHDWKQMLEKEDLEAVIIATPLFTHADLVTACLGAGKHVLCEKMMAWDVAGCHRMREAALKNKRVLEFGYHRFHSPSYQAAHEAIIAKEVLGDIYSVRCTWHRDKPWRRSEKPPTPDFDPRPWGYDSWDHLVNWRLFRKYSRGLAAELGSHQISITNWFLGAVPEAVYAHGSVNIGKESREEFDHIYATFDYPGGRNTTFTSIETNAFDNTYEQFMGTKGTLVMAGNGEAFLFHEKASQAVAAASESQPAVSVSVLAKPSPAGAPKTGWWLAYQNEIADFCAAIREGAPLRCGPDKAMGSAAACIRAEEAGFAAQRLAVTV
jgi:predicted dehydrogenase